MCTFDFFSYVMSGEETLKAKSLILGSVIGLLIGFASGYGFLSQTELKTLMQKKDALETQNAALQAEILSLRSRTGVMGVYFSPKGGCESQVIYWISRANVSIHILIYSFTLDSIGDALINASSRGADVKIVFEKSQISIYSEYNRLKTAGIPVRNDTNPDLMHDKVMIVDGTIVLTGSFNWSASAENDNNENLIIINSTFIASIYATEFQKIWNQSA